MVYSFWYLIGTCGTLVLHPILRISIRESPLEKVIHDPLSTSSLLCSDRSEAPTGTGHHSSPTPPYLVPKPGIPYLVPKPCFPSFNAPPWPRTIWIHPLERLLLLLNPISTGPSASRKPSSSATPCFSTCPLLKKMCWPSPTIALLLPVRYCSNALTVTKARFSMHLTIF